VESGEIAPTLAKMEFVPLRVECISHMDKFEFVGISKLFEYTKLGEMIPEYDVLVNDLGLDISVSVSKVA